MRRKSYRMHIHSGFECSRAKFEKPVKKGGMIVGVKENGRRHHGLFPLIHFRMRFVKMPVCDVFIGQFLVPDYQKVFCVIFRRLIKRIEISSAERQLNNSAFARRASFREHHRRHRCRCGCRC
jgi:hypothetical protein